MGVQILFRLAGAAVLGLALAGCIDVNMDVHITSETTATGTLTQVMSAQVYPMVKASAEDGGEGFCAKGELTENADGSATCVMVQQGAFSDLTFDQDGGKQSVSFTSVGPGLVRVAFDTKDMAGAVTEGSGEDMDADAKAMLEAYFEGHFLTLSVKGGEITDTNMDLADDAMSAVARIEFIGLINGTAKLPEELYAVVRK